MFTKRFVSIPALAITLSSLAGCATFSREQCQTMDWNGRGYETASNAQSVDSGLAYYREACGKEYGIDPDEPQFRKGHATGLLHLCTRSGGSAFGATGRAYTGICPKDKEDEFMEGFKNGKLSYLEARVQSLQDENSQLRSELNNKDDEISSLQRRLSSCESH